MADAHLTTAFRQAILSMTSINCVLPLNTIWSLSHVCRWPPPTRLPPSGTAPYFLNPYSLSRSLSFVQVTDAHLTAAFNKYSSFNKAKVVRSSHNNKTKGYGFVSLGDIQEGAKCLREMQGKYIGGPVGRGGG